MRYPALDDPESSIEGKLIKKRVAFHYFINWQHPALIPRMLLVFQMTFRRYDIR
jgi:hypothetical protein